MERWTTLPTTPQLLCYDEYQHSTIDQLCAGIRAPLEPSAGHEGEYLGLTLHLSQTLRIFIARLRFHIRLQAQSVINNIIAMCSHSVWAELGGREVTQLK